MEHGESAEEAAARELFEETGVRVDAHAPMQYVSSQPWPFPASLMLGFVARAASARHPITLDTHELEDARYVRHVLVQCVVLLADT